MAKHLSDRDIKAIADLIHGWSGTRITWEAVCEAAEARVGKRPTRQSLSSHETIADAYRTVKKGLRESGPKLPRPASLKLAGKRIRRLEREVEQLREENRRLKQQFIVWQYNAYKHGLKEHQLNAPLPRIDRERSDGAKK